MSIQYTDGSFSDNMPIEMAIEKFTGHIKNGDRPVQALFVGTEKELDIRKRKLEFRKLLEDLEQRVSSIEEKITPLESNIIHIPTKKELDNAIENISQEIKSRIFK